MGAKEKIIGILLIIIGALPFLLNIQEVLDFFSKNGLLFAFTPGEIVYQIIIIVLGVLLIWTFRVRGRIETR